MPGVVSSHSPLQSQEMMRLDEILNARRIEQGLTYEQVHERLERYPWPPTAKAPSLAVVGHWFNGTRRPRKMEHLKALCDVLDVSLDEAVSGSPAQAVTAVEQVLLHEFRKLSPRAQENLIALMAALEKK